MARILTLSTLLSRSQVNDLVDQGHKMEVTVIPMVGNLVVQLNREISNTVPDSKVGRSSDLLVCVTVN